MRIRTLFAVALLLVIPASLRAERPPCSPPSISLSSTESNLHVTLSASGSCGGHGFRYQIDDETVLDAPGCASSPCTVEFDVQTICMRTGTHTIKAWNYCSTIDSSYPPEHSSYCASAVTGEASASFEVDTKPRISASYSADEFGNGTLTGTYEFPNTKPEDWYQSYTSRLIRVFLRSPDGSSTLQTQIWGDTKSGTFTFTSPGDAVGITCLPGGSYAWLVEGRACPGDGPYYNAYPENITTEEVPVTVPSRTPTLNVTANDVGTLTAKFTFSGSATFPNTSTTKQRRVDLFLIDPTGYSTFFEGYDIGPGTSGTFSTSEKSFECALPGDWKVRAVAKACESSAPDCTTIKEQPFVVPSRTPIVTVAASGPALADGKIDISGSYNFPNTEWSGYRYLQVYWVDLAGAEASISTYWDGSVQSDTYTATHYARCLAPGTYKVRTRAKSCRSTDPDCNVMVETDVVVPPSDPTINIGALTKVGGNYETTITWSIPTSSKKSVEVYLRHPKSGNSEYIWGVNGQASGSQPLSFAIPPVDKILIARVSGCTLKTVGAPVPKESCSNGEGGGCKSATFCPFNAPNAGKAKSNGTPSPATNAPVRYDNGNMRYMESGPLPLLIGTSLQRTYDSLWTTQGVFGRGWGSAFDAVIDPFDGTSGRETVFVVDESKDQYLFNRQASGEYRQTYPTGSTDPAVLQYESATATYAFRYQANGTILRFRASDRKLIEYRDPISGENVTITYDTAGLPTQVQDSRGLTLAITTDSTRKLVTAIADANQPLTVWTYEYDAANNLTRILAPDNQQWRRYEYTGGWLTAVYDPLDHLIESHTYDSTGRAISSDGNGDAISSMQYDLAGRVTGEKATVVTHHSGRVATVYTRWIAGRDRTVEVVNGCASCGAGDAVYAYDAEGHLVREQDGSGYVERLTLDGDARVTRIETHLRPAGCDPETSSTHCRLTPEDLTTATLDTSSATTVQDFTYDDPLWPDQPTTVRRTSVMSPSEDVVETYVYHPSTGVVISRTTSGFTGTTPLREDRTVSATIYDGIAPAAFDPGGTFNSAWLSLPQPFGHVRQTDGPRTDVTDLTESVYYPWDASVPGTLRGRLAATRNAAGQIVRHEAYDAFGNVTRTVDPNGLVTETTYDYLGRPITTTVKGVAGCDTVADPLCATDLVTTRVYHPGGGPLLREERAGSVTVYAYDAKGRVASISRGPSASDLREQLEYGYDTSGRKISEKTFAFESGVWVEKRSTTFEYDTEGRLTATVHPDGARVEYAYDASHDLVSVKDENNVAPNTFYEYDPASRLTEVRQSLGAGEVVTAYGYDAHGNLTSGTDPNGNVTSYLYDDFGQMLRQVSPVTGTTTYLYDAAGNMTSTTDATGATTTRSYDVLGRPTSAVSVRSGAASEQVTWTYDTGAFGAGRLARMDDPTGYTTYAWTRLGQLAREDKSVAGAIWTSTFQYDLAGNRSLIGYPSGRQVTYGHDFAGRPVSAADGATPLVSSATYLPFGPMTSATYGNSTAKSMTYDARYRPQTNALTGPGGTIASYAYGYDSAGNITAIDDLVDPAYSRGFGYDDLHRLITANGGTSLWGSGTYEYDAMGNMTSLALGAARTATFAYSGTTPKLTTVTEDGVPRSISYDAAGNEILVGAVASTYSARNHLLESEGLTYAYDGRGVRTLTTVTGSGGSLPPTGSAKVNVYSPELQLLTESAFTTSTPAPAWDYVLFAGQPLAQIEVSTGVTRWTFTDHLGTPVIQTDATGTIAWRLEQEPYGTEFAFRAGSSLHQPLRFPGQERGVESELAYNVFRWYRGGWGRYSQADPVGLEADVNLFRYATNRPLVATDPLGLDSRVCCRPLHNIFGKSLFGYKHCYIESNSRGRRETWGLYKVNGYGEPKKNHVADKPQPGTKCTKWFDDPCEDGDCFTKAANSYPYEKYSYAAGSGLSLGKNSNTFARCVWEKCKGVDTDSDWMSVLGPVASMAPGWNAPCPN